MFNQGKHASINLHFRLAFFLIHNFCSKNFAFFVSYYQIK
jgi:hypothetical protein